MICPSCDSPDCGFVVSAGPWDTQVHWYRCYRCWKWATGPVPVCVDFDEDEEVAR